MNIFRIGCALFIVGFLGACAQTQAQNPNVAPISFSARSKILLPPPDVELYEMTAAGLLEPRADWTSQGEANIRNALRAQGARRNTAFHEVAFDNLDPERAQTLGQIVKLHEAVAASMLAHQQGVLRLPTKKGVYSWSLGPEVSALREAGRKGDESGEDGGEEGSEEGVTAASDAADADYALFVTLYDSYSSAGRRAVQLVGALLGVGVPGGVQVGYASLVELNTGDVAWFGSLARGTGDVRSADEANSTVADLLNGLPE